MINKQPWQERISGQFTPWKVLVAEEKAPSREVRTQAGGLLNIMNEISFEEAIYIVFLFEEPLGFPTLGERSGSSIAKLLTVI